MSSGELYIHGYEFPWSLGTNSLKADEADDGLSPSEAFDLNTQKLLSFLECRDARLALSKTAHQCILETIVMNKPDPSIEFGSLEILQALYLTRPPRQSRIPTAPGSFSRHWRVLGRMMSAFMSEQGEALDTEDKTDVLVWRVRLQTVFYRFPYDQDVCAGIIGNILSRVDAKVAQVVPFAEQYARLLGVSRFVSDRITEFYANCGEMLRAKTHEDVNARIKYFCARSTVAARLWERCRHQKRTVRDLSHLGYQLSELATPWLFALEKEELVSKFGDEILPLIDRFSHSSGELAGADPRRFIMDNPVWQKPFITMPDETYLLPIPHFPYSHPFRIAEHLIGNEPKVRTAYSDARAEYLEDAMAETLELAMPSASIYRSVIWDDPATGVRYENDVVVVLDNFLFMFEAKSGKISPAARRGAGKSLNTNVSDLFIGPAKQARRLQKYLNDRTVAISLRDKKTGKPVPLNLDRLKIAFSYSICLEHFASLSATREFFAESGILGADEPWAPVLSLGELDMVSRFLDSEVSFAHYLTRRPLIGTQLDYDGDEQDLLSMYLTNGFCLLGRGPEDKRILFHNSDAQVRKRTVPAINRATPAIVGITLPPMWQRTVSEIYDSSIGTVRHRFDIICTILNQPPPALSELQEFVRKWRRGGGGAGKGPRYSIYTVANRQFVVATWLLSKGFGSEEALMAEARLLAHGIASEFDGTSDVVVFIYLKKPREITHNGVFFFRLGREGIGRVI
ncbi:hypothetical protein SAMN04488020_1209 [Palleronia marisminoris]|uniref:Nuclease-related domain protein n=1 Tax=Palleronia marisminoris TaxID=315423 RepID=A0A1Y5TYG7_9RHOB|nr:hypothetical protein [Palleronia marisminoris]SFH52507.1 hypothetical protein SAMN04488020_1209 [Palleronia marisminoris]SLN71581.1 hypothetical protein PAM7066_03669 [Palleronia marisminoris]